jgi:hypothetical protein
MILSKETLTTVAVAGLGFYFLGGYFQSFYSYIPVINGLGADAQMALAAGIWGGIGCTVAYGGYI